MNVVGRMASVPVVQPMTQCVQYICSEWVKLIMHSPGLRTYSQSQQPRNPSNKLGL